MSDSEFLHHVACSECGSSDAGALYSDGHVYCFVCHTTTHNGTTLSSSKSSKIEIQGEPEQLKNRGISSSTCRKFQALKEGSSLRFYYRNRAGAVCAAKVRTPGKEFWWEGSNVDGQFYGQHLVQAGTTRDDFKQRLIITEGEFDTLSVAEVFPNYNVVSLPDGAPSAKKSVQKQLEWLQQFSEIILFFDSDAEGRAATEAVSNILPTGTVKIARLPPEFKDASDALQAGKQDLLKKAIWNAESWVPGGIVSWQDMVGDITTPNPPCSSHYPWSGLDAMLHGIRPQELITATAGSGIGKSSLYRQLAVHLLNQGEAVGYLALEESNRRTALGLMSASLGQSFHTGTYSAKELLDAYDQTKSWKLHLFDGFGSYDPDVVYRRIEYLALGLDVKVVFLDHLSILLSGLDGDERRMIDQTMTKLRSLVERTGVTMFLISHLKRIAGEGKNHEEGGRVTLGHLRGSQSIAQLSDAVIALERDQQGGGSTTLRVLKNRFTGETGPCSVVQWDGEKCIYQEVESLTPGFSPEQAAAVFDDY
jgi:twinkle protein